MRFLQHYKCLFGMSSFLILISFSSCYAETIAHQFRHATFPTNPGNYAKEGIADKGILFDVGMGGESDWGFGIAGAFLTVTGQLVFDVTSQGSYKPVDLNSFAGFLIDYKTPSGYLKRVAYDFMGLSDQRTDFFPPWGKGTPPDKVVRLDIPLNKRISVDLSQEAPIGWNNQIWLSVMVENTGVGTSLQIRLSDVTYRQAESTMMESTPFSTEGISWNVIPFDNVKITTRELTASQKAAFDHFTNLLPPACSNQATPELNVIIAAIEHLNKLSEDKQAELYSLLKDSLAWKEHQGYVIRHYPKEHLLIVTSLGGSGLVYAISHLQRSLVLEPQIAIALESDVVVEKPSTEERGIYINIGYGLSSGPITPDNWNEKEWESFIDQLVLARITFWSFFLWTEIEHIYPETTDTVWKPKNEHVFKMLRYAIDYSHQRGLRAVYLFTPTNIPAEIVLRHPDWATTLEYTNSAGICSRKSDAYELAKIIHRYQMEYFSNADEYDIAFYDPGGCMCSECSQQANQCNELVKQVKDFSSIGAQVNPGARFGFWTWAVWRYERKHHYSLRDCLLPTISRNLAKKTENVVVIDSFHGDEGSQPFFEQAKALNFRTSNFVYQTNIEDGHVFLLPLMDFQQKWARMSQENQIDESFLMIMEVCSKMPMAAFGAEFFWNANLKKETVAERYALQLTHGLESARSLRDGFLTLEELTYKGVIGNDNIASVVNKMSESFDKTFGNLSSDQQAELKYLLTTAQVYKLLVQASEVRSRGDNQLYEKCKNEFLYLTRQDPLFAHFSEHAAPLFFDRMVGWVSNGFINGYF